TATRHGEQLLDLDDTIEQVGGRQSARVPGDPEDPEAVAVERQGRELLEPGGDAPAAGIAGRVEDLDPAHPPAAGVEPAAVGADRQAADRQPPGEQGGAAPAVRRVDDPHDPLRAARRQSATVGAEGDRPQLPDLADTEDPRPTRRVPDAQPVLEWALVFIER